MTIILQVSRSISPSGDDATIERILAEYEPLVARTRRVMAGVWQDRRMSRSSMQVLVLLELHGPLRMSRLARLLDVSLPNATGIVTRMEELGVVERGRDDADRRAVVVRPTAAGRALIDEMDALRRDHFRRILASLDPEEQAVCLRAFTAMRRAAERIDGDEPETTP